MSPRSEAALEASPVARFKTAPPKSPARRQLRRTVARLTRFAAPSDAGSALRILTYHRVNADHPGDRLSVHPAAFAAQMETLARTGRPVLPLDRAVMAMRGSESLPPRAVAITFDDGFADNFDCAVPILARFSFPATFFVATSFMGTSSCTDRYTGCCATDGAMSWSQVGELASRGHVVGGHTRTHPELKLLGSERVWDEVDGCRRDLAQQAGVEASLFCYPRGSESASVRDLVRRAGFTAACSVYPGSNPPDTDPFALRRTEVSGDDTLEDFRLKLEGGFDGWHRLIQRLQARGPS
jgi:peptidoglycan/xylan/chitin deacetylase (PgdA/CDA1 family)